MEELRLFTQIYFLLLSLSSFLSFSLSIFHSLFSVLFAVALGTRLFLVLCCDGFSMHESSTRGNPVSLNEDRELRGSFIIISFYCTCLNTVNGGRESKPQGGRNKFMKLHQDHCERHTRTPPNWPLPATLQNEHEGEEE